MVYSIFTTTARKKLRFLFSGKILPTQLIPIATFVLNIPGRNSSATAELVFLAENLPPLGYKAYHVTKKAGNEVTEGITIKNSISLNAKAWVSLILILFGVRSNRKLLGRSCDC